MNKYEFIRFEGLKNIHIFENERNTSACGRVKKPEHIIADITGYYTAKDARLEACALQNLNENLCGKCVAVLYSDEI